jgi:DNA-directed RNA polymerase subunit beta'
LAYRRARKVREQLDRERAESIAAEEAKSEEMADLEPTGEAD